MTLKQNRQYLIYGAIALVVLTFAAYLPAMNGGFIWDDDLHVSDNQFLRSGSGLYDIWFDVGSLPQYYPMTFTSFWLNYQFGGLDTTGYHVVNVLLHIANALLIWLVLSWLEVPFPWFAAALFALHPVHVETAAWMSERKNLLSTFFYLISFLTYLRFRGLGRFNTVGGDSRDWKLYAASLLLFAAALLSKTVTSTLPAAMLLVIWWKNGRITLRDFLPLIPFFAIGIASGLLTVHMEKHHVGAVGTQWDFTIIDRILIAGRVLWFYAMKLVLPLKLTFNYPQWTIDSGAWWQYLFPLFALVVIILLWVFRNSIGRGPLTGVLFFAGTLFPALGFFDVYPFQYSFVADHFQYLASVGVLALMAAFGSLVIDRDWLGRGQALAFGLAIMAVLWVLTIRQTPVYQSIDSVWEDTIKKNPRSWMAHNNLGIFHYKRGALSKAASNYLRALEIKPDHAKALFNFGDTLQAGGLYDEAIAQYREALKYRPDDVSTYLNMGVAYKKKGDFESAVESYRKAIELSPDFADSYYNLGLALLDQERFDDAIGNFRKAVELRPRFGEAWNNLGTVLFKNGKTYEAIKAYEHAASCDPTNYNVQYNLGYLLARQGNTDTAIRHFRNAIRFRPDFASAHYNLALALEMQGNKTEAQKHFGIAKKLGR